jgi:two-component system sensor histidine kinase AlgZ
LRFSLRSAAEHEVPLERELEVLRRYVEIQRLRFSDRLRVELHIAPEARRALVPSLILQPLVENAIRHGIAPRAAGGLIEVRAECDGDTLHLMVADDGVGVPGGEEGGRGVREGVGLSNTRARLRHLYGDGHVFHAAPGPTGGFVVRMTIPYRVHGAPAPAPALEGVA